MSGIEIAGLVLGAFPVLIEALERYRSGAGMFQDWWKFRRAYTEWEQELAYHHLLYERNLERFLLPLVVDDSELKTLVADPTSDKWADPELETRLKRHLQKEYDIVLSIIANINECIESLKNDLGLDNPALKVKLNQVWSLASPIFETSAKCELVD